MPRSHAGLAPWIVTRIAGAHGIGRWQNRALRAPAVAAIVIALLLLGTGGQARASGLHRLASSAISFSSDGVRYAAWQVHAGGPLIVLDTLTGRQKAMALPAGCGLDEEDEGEDNETQTGARGRFLLTCTSGEEQRQVLFNVTTGASVALPDNFDWYRLGTFYVEGNRYDGGPFIDDIRTGRVRRAWRGASVDLDRARVPAHAICVSLRQRARKLGWLPYIGQDFGYENGVFAGQYGGHGEVQIDRCDGHSVILEAQFVSGRWPEINHGAHDFDLRGGIISWDTGGQPAAGEYTAAGEYSFRATLSTYTLATGARHRWSLPRVRVAQAPENPPPGSWGHSAHTTHMVFWIATRTDSCDELCSPATTAVYGARL